MNYNKLLNQLIDNSGMTLKEIAQTCKEMGESISANYLSVLKTVEDKTASDKVSLAIAKACNAKYDNILVVQAYIDKAPQPIMDFFNYAKNTTHAEALLFIENEKGNMTEYEYKKYRQTKEQEFENQSLAEFICETISDMSLPTKEGFKQQMELLNSTLANYPSSDNLYAVIPIDKDKSVRYLTESEIRKLSE